MVPNWYAGILYLGLRRWGHNSITDPSPAVCSVAPCSVSWLKKHKLIRRTDFKYNYTVIFITGYFPVLYLGVRSRTVILFICLRLKTGKARRFWPRTPEKWETSGVRLSLPLQIPYLHRRRVYTGTNVSGQRCRSVSNIGGIIHKFC